MYELINFCRQFHEENQWKQNMMTCLTNGGFYSTHYNCLNVFSEYSGSSYTTTEKLTSLVYVSGVNFLPKSHERL